MIDPNKQGKDTPPTLIITGPTAIGKSRLAMSLAQQLNAELVSADSMQVYCGLNIGTAKPSAEDRRVVVHHGIDLLNPEEIFSMGKFIDQTRQTVAEIRLRDKAAIIVGGTGFYLKALCHDFQPVPVAPDLALREKIQAEVAENSRKAWERLGQLDPQEALRVSPFDSYRLCRALEVLEQTGKSLPSISSQGGVAKSPFVVLCLRMERATLLDHIARRVDAMLAAGLVAEVEGLLARGYHESLPVFKAIGYRETINFLKNVGKPSVVAYQKLRDDIVIHTRQLAKSQYTWFRKFEREWPPERFYWLDTDGGVSTDEIFKIPGLRQRLHYY